ncbi:hypothetical protein [Streptacidiphilus cavernicola]|uniref:Uncharacterized protein n=1 Tax=Streptacidiphilus cavernicola TaxID=3342716 RepID=A0ABV6VY29_9ACTN
MNTTTAAAKARVTVATIRHWCRYGAVAATKTSGRWDIDEASLAYRVTLGKKATMDRFEITESTDKYGRTLHTVSRTDGTETDFRVYHATYLSREQAETHCEFVNRTPAEYHIRKEQHSGRQIGTGTGYYWKITSSRNEDPTDLKKTLDLNHEIKGAWPAGTRIVDMLVHWALQHAEGAPKRIAEKAERDAIEAAESAVREVRAAQLAELRRTRGELATPRQVDYILRLLAARERSGEGGGFFYGPKDRAGIEEMSKADASSYITSLKGDY